MAQGLMEIQLSATQYNGGYNIRCYGGSSGQINTIVIGGTAPISYLWSNGATTQLIDQLVVGTFTVTVTQSGGNTATASITLREPTVLNPSLYSPEFAGGTNISINGGNDGSIQLTDQGGTPPYEYVWSNNIPEQNQYNLAAGAYTVTVTDANACTVTQSIILTEPSPLSITNISSPLFNGYNIHCNASNDGTIDLTIAGGAPPYDILWNNGSFDEDPTGLVAGDYAVRVTDQNGTQVEESITLTEPPALSVQLVPFFFPNNYNISLFGGYDGSITANTGGGVAPYTFLWNDANTSQNRTTLNHGTKALTVTDANGCAVASEIMLLEPASADWMMNGNANTDPATKFIGTTDSTDFVFRTNNQERLKIKSDGVVTLKNFEGQSVNVVYADSNGVLRTYPTDPVSPAPPPSAVSVPWVTHGNHINDNDYIGTNNGKDFVIKTALPPVVNGNTQIFPVPVQRMIVYTDGRVYIGDPAGAYHPAPPPGTSAVNYGYLLSVNGKILSTDVTVKSRTAWPDFVFSDNYPLLSLEKLQDYVHSYNHLPGFPSAGEIAAKGNEFSLGETALKTIEKTEENTKYILQLYQLILQQQKEIEKLKLQAIRKN